MHLKPHGLCEGNCHCLGLHSEYQEAMKQIPNLQNYQCVTSKQNVIPFLLWHCHFPFLVLVFKKQAISPVEDVHCLPNKGRGWTNVTIMLVSNDTGISHYDVGLIYACSNTVKHVVTLTPFHSGLKIQYSDLFHLYSRTWILQSVKFLISLQNIWGNTGPQQTTEQDC